MSDCTDVFNGPALGASHSNGRLPVSAVVRSPVPARRGPGRHLLPHADKRQRQLVRKKLVRPSRHRAGASGGMSSAVSGS